MAAEVLAALKPRPGGRYADGTVGGAGHAAGILAASSPTGWLSGCDRDGAAVEAATRRLAEKFAGRFEIRRGNFAEMAEWIPAASCDGCAAGFGREFAAIGFAGARVQLPAGRPAGHADGRAAGADGGGAGERRRAPKNWRGFFGNSAASAIRGGWRRPSSTTARSGSLRRRGNWRN